MFIAPAATHADPSAPSGGPSGAPSDLAPTVSPAPERRGDDSPVRESVPDASAVLVGVYAEGMAQDIRRYDDFRSTTGNPLGIVHWYQPWGAAGYSQTTVDSDALSNVSSRGAAPMITWEAWGSVDGRDPSVLRDITAGHFDAHIDRWAADLRAFGQPVFLRVFHEMNNPRYPWAIGQNGNTAADLIAAWRYVHQRFERAAATNVLWVWSPNTENSLVRFGDIYPGDDYVDWLGVDGYNGGTDFKWGGWCTPADCFRRSLDSFASMSPTKPVMIAETSSVEHGGDKAAWVRGLFDLPLAYPSIKAIVWFHEDFSSRGEADWRIDTSPSALQAYRAAVTLPMFAGATPADKATLALSPRRPDQ